MAPGRSHPSQMRSDLGCDNSRNGMYGSLATSGGCSPFFRVRCPSTCGLLNADEDGCISNCAPQTRWDKLFTKTFFNKFFEHLFLPSRFVPKGGTFFRLGQSWGPSRIFLQGCLCPSFCAIEKNFKIFRFSRFQK